MNTAKINAVGRIIVTILLLCLSAYLFSINEKGTAGTIVATISYYWLNKSSI
jgi:hypothetical protein